MTTYITTGWLNLRSEPVINKNNVMGVMPPDTVVTITGEKNATGWVKVKAQLGKTRMEGFAAFSYLVPTKLPLPNENPVDPAIIPAVHLPLRTNKVIRRNNTEGRAYPLNEPGLVKADLSTITGTTKRITTIHKVIDWLNVERNDRYSPTTKNTYCNIYAYDVAYCLGAYLPRVWWNEEAVVLLQKRKPVEPLYDRTVRELNANSLTNWFERFGPSYQWKRMTDLTSLQQLVNKGKLGIIVAQRTNLNYSGHIVAVVPETADHKASWKADKVISPLQSQAGSNNKKYFTGNNWWINTNKFRKFGWWVWDV